MWLQGCRSTPSPAACCCRSPCTTWCAAPLETDARAWLSQTQEPGKTSTSLFSQRGHGDDRCSSRRHRESLPSIAVLPLQNLGGDPADDYFADGIVEDIIVSLAGLRELFVISRASTIKYRGSNPDPREVGQSLGARYIVFGSVRRSERLVRVSIQACDSETMETLWGDAVEVAPGELFDLQDHIVRKIVAGIAPKVRNSELRNAMRKKPESFTAYDYALRGIQIINSLDKQTFLKAREFLNKAIAEDQQFAMPVAWAARWHSMYVGQGWSPNPNEDAVSAAQLAARAIELDGQNALALATFGHVKSFLFHEYDGAMIYLGSSARSMPQPCRCLDTIERHVELYWGGGTGSQTRGARFTPFAIRSKSFQLLHVSEPRILRQGRLSRGREVGKDVL